MQGHLRSIWVPANLIYSNLIKSSLINQSVHLSIYLPRWSLPSNGGKWKLIPPLGGQLHSSNGFRTHNGLTNGCKSGGPWNRHFFSRLLIIIVYVSSICWIYPPNPKNGIINAVYNCSWVGNKISKASSSSNIACNYHVPFNKPYSPHLEDHPSQ